MKTAIHVIISVVIYCTTETTAAQLFGRQGENGLTNENPLAAFMNQDASSPMGMMWNIATQAIGTMSKGLATGVMNGAAVVKSINGIATTLEMFAPMNPLFQGAMNDDFTKILKFFKGSMCLADFIDLFIPAILTILKNTAGSFGSIVSMVSP